MEVVTEEEGQGQLIPQVFDRASNNNMILFLPKLYGIHICMCIYMIC